MRYIYLAGPIELVAFADAMHWRDKVTAHVRANGVDVQCINPYRNHGEGEKGAPARAKDAPLINRRDKYLVRSSDFLLVNLTQSNVVGSLIEVGMFAQMDRPVFAWTNPHTGKALRDHPMLRDIVCAWETDVIRLTDMILEFTP